MRSLKSGMTEVHFPMADISKTLLGSRTIDITGKQFGSLTVLSAYQKNTRNEIVWMCKCVCGNTVINTGSHIRSGYVKSCGCSRLGHGNATGMRHSDETKAKMSERVSREWATGLRHPCLGKKLSIEQKELLSKIRRGSNNPAWIDGRTKLTSQVRRCFKTKEWRTAIMLRDNWTCALCNRRGGYLEVDHYPDEFSKIWSQEKIVSVEQAIACERFWDTRNGRTLCKECHAKTKKYANNTYK